MRAVSTRVAVIAVALLASAVSSGAATAGQTDDGATLHARCAADLPAVVPAVPPPRHRRPAVAADDVTALLWEGGRSSRT